MKRIMMLLLTTQLAYGSLTTFEKHASSLPEVPEVSYATFEMHPDYSRWHHERQPSLVTRLLNVVGLYRPAWSPEKFVSILAQVSKERQRLTSHTLFIHPKNETQFIIIGPLYGSYHSLLRILAELNKKQLLTDQLTLTKKDYYLVFTGDTINGSPYNMETLSLILHLMAANPEQVIYLKGAQEKNDTWRGFGFANELAERVGKKEIKKIVVKISSFFETLPTSLIITDGSDNIMIGNDASAQCPLEKAIQGELTVCSSKEGEPLPITAAITSERRIMSYAQHGGLVQAPAKLGALTWAVFSAPNRTFRRYYKFWYDAFAVLTIGNSLAQSVISLYNQEVLQKPGFIQATRYAVLSGKDLSIPLITDNPFIPSATDLNKVSHCKKIPDLAFAEAKAKKMEPLYIGCTLDLTKGASPLGRRLRDGITLRVNQVNQTGGIHGRPVKIVFMDDGYSPPQARTNVESFIKTYKSNLFLCNLGSPTTEYYKDLMEQQKIFVFFPSTGAPIFRQPSMKGLVHWRASFKSEGKALTRFVKEQFGITNFVFLYQDDSFGRGALAGAQEVITKSTDISYERNVSSFKPQIIEMKDTAPSAVGFFSTSIAATEFIRQTGVEFFIDKKVFGLSDLAEESFKKFADSRGLSMILAQFTPNPEISTLEIAKDFREVLRQQGGAAGDVFMFEGYISTSLALYILQQSQDLTPQGINSTLETLTKDSYKGLPLSFSEKTRELTQLLWIDTGDPTWIRQELS